MVPRFDLNDIVRMAINGRPVAITAIELKDNMFYYDVIDAYDVKDTVAEFQLTKSKAFRKFGGSRR